MSAPFRRAGSRSLTSVAGNWDRLIRFVPEISPGSTGAAALIGEPLDSTLDVGAAAFAGIPIEVAVFEGKSILSAGKRTARTERVRTLLSPLRRSEVGAIRCIGLNYVQHAKETNLPLPTVPIVFLKPDTALCGPHPDRIVVPKFTQSDKSADYESEMAVIIGTDCRDVAEEDVYRYVLGYTAANDVSSRKSQFDTSQWTFSKGFDNSCPLGPAVISTRSCPDPSKLFIKGSLNGKTMQQSSISDLIFDVPKMVAFLSQGTTLRAGTVILTGTPSGIGFSTVPKTYLQDEDRFTVEITGGRIGTLVNIVEYEK